MTGMTSTCIARLNKEIKQLELDPPPGVTAWPKDDKINNLEALVQGPEGTPYEGGTFKLEVVVPDRYPFEPPKIRFVTPIYHPNIDSGGRICLDTLNMPPKGQWKPAVNLSTLLATIQQLLGDPNPDDGLVPEITMEFKRDRMKFEAEARARTMRDAVDSTNSTLRTFCSANKTDVPPDKQAEQRPSQDNSDGEESEEEDDDKEEEEIASLWGNSAGSQSQRAESSMEVGSQRAEPSANAGEATGTNGSAQLGGYAAEDVVEDSEEEGSGDDIFTQSFLGGQPDSASKRPLPAEDTGDVQQSRQRQKTR